MGDEEDLRAAMLAANGFVEHPLLDVIVPIPGTPDGVKPLPDGRYMYVSALLFGAAAIAVDDAQGRTFGGYWRYLHRRSAVEAAVAWDGEGEPAGWYKHPATGRCRPDGDPTRERIDP